MRTISILQPWAWLIVRPDIVTPQLRKQPGLLKDIENRSWCSAQRGRVLVHTGKSYTRAQHDEYVDYIGEEFGIPLPAYDALPRGGIVGSVEITDCVRSHTSRWKDPHSFGFVLANAIPLPFREVRGQLGFFEVEDKCRHCGCTDSHACPGGCYWAAPHVCSSCI